MIKEQYKYINAVNAVGLIFKPGIACLHSVRMASLGKKTINSQSSQSIKMALLGKKTINPHSIGMHRSVEIAIIPTILHSVGMQPIINQ